MNMNYKWLMEGFIAGVVTTSFGVLGGDYFGWEGGGMYWLLPATIIVWYWWRWDNSDD